MKWIDMWGDRKFQALSEYIISFLKMLIYSDDMLEIPNDSIFVQGDIYIYILFFRSISPRWTISSWKKNHFPLKKNYFSLNSSMFAISTNRLYIYIYFFSFHSFVPCLLVEPFLSVKNHFALKKNHFTLSSSICAISTNRV